ncbi:hypothetical protein [Methanobrevibacter sp.]|uniref:hypothetical protein n=1 Tax=Methanobrevibacter sp. TaxID=66852 RepID=UPI00388E6708
MARDKITRSQYEYLKNIYLNKNRSMHTLYIEINQKTKVDRHLFFNLINKIRLEEGLRAYYTQKKVKNKKKIIKHSDKSPKHYN